MEHTPWMQLRLDAASAVRLLEAQFPHAPFIARAINHNSGAYSDGGVWRESSEAPILIDELDPSYAETLQHALLGLALAFITQVTVNKYSGGKAELQIRLIPEPPGA